MNILRVAGGWENVRQNVLISFIILFMFKEINASLLSKIKFIKT